MAHDAASRADLILFVTDSDLNQTEYAALARAGRQPQADHPGVQQDRQLHAAQQRQQLREALADSRLRGIVGPDDVVRDRGRSPAPRIR